MDTEQPSTIRHSSRPLFVAKLAVLGGAAFVAGQSVAAQLAGPSLILEDSVILQETSQVYVGQPVEMFLGDDGSIFVIDGFSNSVVRFDEMGRIVETYGRHGGGPGEFSYIGAGGFAQRRSNWTAVRFPARMSRAR